ncbi:MAG TPA: TolC family protein [Planctomycetes bacterium]|nr:TolC family protein [Planctomycetota bacterium]
MILGKRGRWSAKPVGLAGLLVVSLFLASCAEVSVRDEGRGGERSRWLSKLSGSRWEGGAGPEVQKALSEREFLELVLLRNRGLKNAYESWKAALQAAGATGFLPEPKAMVGVFLEPVETRVGPQRAFVRLGQAFPLTRRLSAKEEAARRRAEAQAALFRQKSLDVLSEAKAGIAAYRFSEDALRISREQLDLLASWSRVLLARFRTAKGRHPDLVRLQVEMGKLEDQIASLKDLLGLRRARLNHLVDRPSDAPLALGKGREGWKRPLPDPKEAEALMQKANQELKALDLLEQAAQAEVRVAGATRTPDLDLGLRWIMTGEARNGGVAGSGDDPIALELGFRLPIQASRYDALERAAKRRRRAAREKRLERQNRLRSRLREDFYHAQEAARRLSLYGDTLLPKARESVQVQLQAFRAGKGNFLDLIDAERVLLDFQLQRSRAQAEGDKARADLEALLGMAWRERDMEAAEAAQGTKEARKNR